MPSLVRDMNLFTFFHHVLVNVPYSLPPLQAKQPKAAVIQVGPMFGILNNLSTFRMMSGTTLVFHILRILCLEFMPNPYRFISHEISWFKVITEECLLLFKNPVEKLQAPFKNGNLFLGMSYYHIGN